jgi:hypothetical protein
MPTQKYKTSDGKRVPGATTVIGTSLGWGKEGLLHWAWKQGADGKDFREERDKAANAGTIAHAMAEANVKGLQQPVRPERCSETELQNWVKAEAAFAAFLDWKESTKFKLILSEVPFVSDEYRFGGTLDSVAELNSNKVCLVDFKTSNSTYPDHLIQMAAYCHLWERGVLFNYPDLFIKREPFASIEILRFSKEGGDFHHSHYRYERMQKPWTAFLALRQLYDLKKDIEGMV